MESNAVVQFFRMPVITSKMDPTQPSSCWRNCGTQDANHTHIFWDCPKLSVFWEVIFEALKVIFRRNVPKTLLVAILGVIPDGLDRKDDRYLLRILLTAALKCITIRWLKPGPPTYNTWIQKVWDIHLMEEITYTLRLQKTVVNIRWSPVIRLLFQ